VRLFLGAIVLAAIAATSPASRTQGAWSIDPKPSLVLGDASADTTELFAVVAGATRLPNGQILVADRAEFTLKLFDAGGRRIRQFGRRGQGPGEVSSLKTMLRCGDSIVTMDLNGNRTSVFALDGKYVRSFRFGSPQTGRPPYRTSCNARTVFAHFGWESRSDMKGGAYRPIVPFWISGADSGIRQVIGQFPGVDRYGLVIDNEMRGSRPMLLGKSPVVGLATDRLYIGSADQYEVQSFDFTGKLIATQRKTNVNLATTPADIQYAQEKELATVTEARRASNVRDYAAMQYPKTIPAYADLVVDSEGFVWIQDYPRAKSATVRWTVFSPQGQQRVELVLPTHLEVYEIGRDYVLGRYLDPAESVPQVHLYRLRRTAGR
jgi:hypothetical protein